MTCGGKGRQPTAAGDAKERPRPSGWVSRKGGSVSWRTVPTFAAGVLATLLAALLVWCRGAARADSAATDRMLRWWAAVWLRAAGARVAVDGLGHLTSAAPCVIVSNHQSSLDPIVQLRTLPLSLRVLVMRELFRIPLLGPALRTIGMIEVDRESPDVRRIDQAAACHLMAGRSLLAYPEGRISPDGVIGEFKDGAFIIAIASQVPVVPVAIEGTRRIWPPGRAAIHGGQVRIVAGSPVPTSGLTEHDVARLRDQARDVICSARRDLVTAMSAKDTNYEQGSEHTVRGYQAAGGSPRRPRGTWRQRVRAGHG
jgi:1-acyl-sn-glycerol-3-phosphate acyltransferase